MIEPHYQNLRGSRRASPLRLFLSLCLLGLGCSSFQAVEANLSETSPVENFDAAWRIIRDSYFDPTFGGVDWDAVRAELRPKAEASASRTQLRAVIQEMLDRLGASHLAILPGNVAQSLERSRGPGSGNGTNPSRGSEQERPARQLTHSREGDLGLELRILEGQPLVYRVDPDGPAGRAGVRPGWILERIDSDSVTDLLKEVAVGLHPNQSDFLAWNLITGTLSGPAGSSVSLRFSDSRNKHVVLVLDRREATGTPSKLGYLPTMYARFESERLSLPKQGIAGLLRFNLWMIPIIRSLDVKMDEFRNLDGVVIDMRGNLGGIGGMILGFSGHFLNERISLGTLKMRGNDLEFFTNPRRVDTTGKAVIPFSGPVAILVDGLSLSAAEIFAAGMQAVGRARVFGEKSGGQALPAVWDRLPNGDVLYHAFGDFVTPKGERLEGRGVIPDQTVSLKRQDLLSGRDAALSAALAWLQEEKGKSHH